MSNSNSISANNAADDMQSSIVYDISNSDDLLHQFAAPSSVSAAVAEAAAVTAAAHNQQQQQQHQDPCYCNDDDPFAAAAAETDHPTSSSSLQPLLLLKNADDPSTQCSYSNSNSNDTNYSELLRYQIHPPTVRSTEEVLVFDYTETTTGVQDETTSSFQDETTATSVGVTSAAEAEATAPIHMNIGTGLLDPQLYENLDIPNKNVGFKEETTTTNNKDLQQPPPVFLNRLQTWRKQAVEVVNKNTNNIEVAQPVQAVQNLWKRTAAARSSSWNTAMGGVTTTRSSNSSIHGVSVVQQAVLEEETSGGSVIIGTVDGEEAKDDRRGDVYAVTTPAKQNQYLNNDGDTAENASNVRSRSSAVSDSGDEGNNDSDYESSSAVSSSAYTDESFLVGGGGTKGGVGMRALQRAAASVVDSYAVVQQTQVFRGRYSATTTPSTPTGSGSALGTINVAVVQQTPENQSTRIRKLSGTAAADHWQQLTARLKPHEYILLLGRGMLGVNLKQCYCLGAGVYTDYLVPGGSACQSGLVAIGDVVVRVGNIDCTKGTIATVPATIAASNRPVHITMATSGAHSNDYVTPTATMQTAAVMIDHVDVAVAVLHCCAKSITSTTALFAETTTSSSAGGSPKSEASNNSDGSMEAETGMSLVQPTSFDNDDDDSVQHPQCPVADILTMNASFFSLDAMVNPTAPAAVVGKAYQQQAAKRNTDPAFTLDFVSAAALTDLNLRHAVRNAFLLCVADGRRLPFLQRYLQKQEQQQAEVGGAIAVTSITTVSSFSAMLSLFVGMFHFADFHGIMPVSTRCETARTIAHKFFLPIVSERDGFVPPEFDFHSVVPDSSLRALEAVLRQNDHAAATIVPRTVFLDFQQAILECLTGAPFLGFMISPDCARMRAYLRNTAPFVNVALPAVFGALTKNPPDPTAAVALVRAKNYFLYILVYLLCMMDQDNFGENDDLLETEGAPGKGSRIENAASGICAALFIRCKLLPAIEAGRTQFNSSGKCCDNDVAAAFTMLVLRCEQLWEFFVAPGVGALKEGPRSTEAANCLQALRSALDDIRTRAQDCDDKRATVELLVDSSLTEKATALADELVFDYAINLHPKFRVHKFHEWLCTEVAKAPNDDTARNQVPTMPTGCVKRLLRKVKFPVGITPHQRSHDHVSVIRDGVTNSAANKSSLQLCNAECAIVFGTCVGLDLASRLAKIPAIDSASNIRRYTCQSVAPDCEEQMSGFLLTPEEIPATLESYAVVPLSLPNPFAKSSRDSWRSADGWEVTLVNFVLPRAEAASEDGEASSLYGVSLMFQRRKMATAPFHIIDSITTELYDDGDEQLDADSPVVFETLDNANDAESYQVKSILRVSSKLPTFCKRLSDPSWSDRVKQEAQDDGTTVAVGLALVSKRNVVFAMRETLSLFLRELSISPKGGAVVSSSCGALVDILGNFIHQDVEPDSLKCILEPYIRRCSGPWLERPIGSQKEAFLQLAGHQLIRCLPPIPLALMFLTALLEQKIVLSSSRRSVLFSATAALTDLLRPLKWCHLMVARVPASLAGDLLQYPAPFVLGLSSDDPGVMELIRDLPPDVTLVDLDVGRVILAPSFAHNNEFGRGTPNNTETSRALRSQVLYLAQSLGGVFGAQLDSQTWCSDNPLTYMASVPKQQPGAPFDSLRTVCEEFIHELLAGIASCCYWVEEALAEADTSKAAVSTVLFDEDRFFHIKKSRERNGFAPLLDKGFRTSAFALSLNDFALVLKLLLRCQSMNAYIGMRERDEMAFSV